MKTKKAMSVAAALLAGLACMGAAEVAAADAAAAKASAGVSLAEARGRIDRAIASPAEMKATMRGLSAADQRQFLADVNAAIAKMPGSDGERTAAFVAVNRAALEGSRKGNVTTLVAETFATVSLYALPEMNESLASDLMNRSTAKGQTYTDEQFVKLAETVMAKVNARVATVDDGDVRAGFAALMMIRGSNSTAPAIVDPIVAAMPATAQDVARKEWFPAALGEGQDKSYEPMLGGDGFGNDPNRQPVVLRVTGPQFADSLLVDVAGWNIHPNVDTKKHNPLVDAEMTEHYNAVGFDAIDPGPSIGAVIEEARGYPGQTTR